VSNTVIQFRNETAGKADAHGYINTYKHIQLSLRPWDNYGTTGQPCLCTQTSVDTNTT